MIEDWDFWKMSMAASIEGDSSVSEREGRLLLFFGGFGGGVNIFSRGCWMRLTGCQGVGARGAVGG